MDTKKIDEVFAHICRQLRETLSVSDAACLETWRPEGALVAVRLLAVDGIAARLCACEIQWEDGEMQLNDEDEIEQHFAVWIDGEQQPRDLAGHESWDFIVAPRVEGAQITTQNEDLILAQIAQDGAVKAFVARIVAELLTGQLEAGTDNAVESPGKPGLRL